MSSANNHHDLEVMREMEVLSWYSNPFHKYIYMADLQRRNESLFYRTVVSNLEETTPILYTPTVGEACEKYSEIYRPERGLVISIDDLGNVATCLDKWPKKDVRVIVVTDGERILGLGDLGFNGMGIPVGKLCLYNAFGGVNPEYCLPVTLDVGTDNKKLLENQFYIGKRRPRERGAKYDQLVDEFVQAAHKKWNCLIQFEDFGNQNAFRFLEKYHSQVCMFNDDIQGTASVVLGCLLSAVKKVGTPLADHKFLMLGAGEAGVGIGLMIVDYLEQAGIPRDQALKKIWFVDTSGLVCKSRKNLAEHKLPFAHEFEGTPPKEFIDAVEAVKPTGIIGVAGMGPLFTEAVIRRMASLNKTPIIFSLSNPTSKSECTADEAYKLTDGRAVFASGSPFNSVNFSNQTYVPGQANNAYIFPAIGLAVLATRAKHVTNQMFIIAAKTLAATVTDDVLATGCVVPPLSSIRSVSLEIAVKVAEHVFEQNLAQIAKPANVREHVAAFMWSPAKL